MPESYGRMTDEELLRAMLGKKALADAAFAEVYARYSRRVYLYCRRITGNRDEADDVYQETFIRFYNHATSEAGIQNVQAYLIRISRNIFLNFKRDNPQWSPLENDDAVSLLPDYDKEEMFNLIAVALDMLDFAYREAFIMRFYQGLSYKEMADVTGDSVSALKVRVMRAKEQIRKIVNPYVNDMACSDKPDEL